MSHTFIIFAVDPSNILNNIGPILYQGNLYNAFGLYGVPVASQAMCKINGA
jgi:hypothetical protein